MKKLKAILAIGLSMTTCALADEFKDKAKKINALYKSGIASLKAGDPIKAKSAFEALLKLQPNHGHARYQLTQLPAITAKVKLAKRKKLFTTTRLKEVHFNKATFEEALQALDALSSKATNEEFTPNFVVQDPTGKLTKKTVNLKLNNIPISAALKYILDSAGATARYDEYATVIRPTGSKAPKTGNIEKKNQKKANPFD